MPVLSFLLFRGLIEESSKCIHCGNYDRLADKLLLKCPQSHQRINLQNLFQDLQIQECANACRSRSGRAQATWRLQLQFELRI